MGRQRWRSLQKDMQLINRRLVKSRSHLAATAQESRISINVMELMQHTHRKIVSSIDLLLQCRAQAAAPLKSARATKPCCISTLSACNELRHTARLLEGRSPAASASTPASIRACARWRTGCRLNGRVLFG